MAAASSLAKVCTLSVLYEKARTACVVFSPQKLFGVLAPFGYGDGNSTPPLSFGKSFMKIRSDVPENG